MNLPPTDNRVTHEDWKKDSQLLEEINDEMLLICLLPAAYGLQEFYLFIYCLCGESMISFVMNLPPMDNRVTHEDWNKTHNY